MGILSEKKGREALELDFGEGIGLCGDLQLRILNVRVDLRRIEILMTENLLERLEINAV